MVKVKVKVKVKYLGKPKRGSQQVIYVEVKLDHLELTIRLSSTLTLDSWSSGWCGLSQGQAQNLAPF